MLSELQLREQLVNFLANKSSLDEFEDWFVQNSWNMHKDSDLAAQRLAYAVELRLAEHDAEHLPADDFRRELAELLRLPIHAEMGASAIIESGSSLGDWVFRSVDRELSKAS